MQDSAPLQTQSADYLTPPAPIAQLPALKSGAQSTEFKLALALILLDLIGSLSGVLPATWAATLATITGVAYKAARTYLKIMHAELSAEALIEQGARGVESEAEHLGMVGKVAVAERGPRSDVAGSIDAGTIILLALLAAIFIALVPACAKVQQSVREDLSGERWTEVGYQPDATPRVTINGGSAQ